MLKEQRPLADFVDALKGKRDWIATSSKPGYAVQNALS